MQDGSIVQPNMIGNLEDLALQSELEEAEAEKSPKGDPVMLTRKQMKKAARDKKENVAPNRFEI